MQWPCVQFTESTHDFGYAALALNGDFPDLEVGDGPAVCGIDEDIVFRFRVRPADQADSTGQEGDGLLSLKRKESFFLKLSAQLLDLKQKIA